MKPINPFQWDRGRIFEAQVLGAGAAVPDDFPTGVPKRSFEECLQEVMQPEVQQKLGWNPDNPPTSVATALMTAIQQALAERGYPHSHVTWFSAAGTGLDAHHHTDCVIKWGDALITVDLTTNKRANPAGKRETPHHILLGPEDLHDWSVQLSTGRRIARLLVEQTTHPPRSGAS